MTPPSKAKQAESKLGPVAYLTGDYPKVSHTFILREVEALRALGVDVRTCSIRTPDASEFRGEEELRARAETFYVLAAARNPLRLLSSHWRAFRHNRQGWLSALALAWRIRAPGMKALLWQVFYFLEAGVLAEHLRSSGVRHLHNHFGNSSCSVALLTSMISDIPFSFTEHGPAIFFEVDRWAIGEKVARASFVVAISHFCRSQLMLFSRPEDWHKIAIVHCGVDPDAYGRAPKSEPGKQVIFVGRMDPVKGTSLLVEAFVRVLAVHPDAHLTFVGDGPARARAEARVQELGMAGSVTFAGFRAQPEVARLLDTADLLVLPSFAEGLPVVLMEALAARVPVIASRVAGVQELVEDGENGFTIPPGDVESLVARMTLLLADPALRATLGQAGRDKVLAAFDIAQEAAWLGHLFEGSLAGTLPASLRPPRETGGQG